MATFNLWQWLLLALVVFAIVLPTLVAAAMIWFGPRHDTPRLPRSVRRSGDATGGSPALSLLSGITGDGS
ncbi:MULTISPECIES: hypothetical protein [Xanthomonas]|uniref:hypothetical protein n=1 Tax=Xanthomonas TaxID=338 RepID=UPI00096DF64B|nr:hypothetical protein [Xanthomonas campestris]MEB1550132.1 hypothetical protein [Xanthomonas campestris pv. campestris]MCC5091598.1 hypothetical protein [Xanthomonas campestris pv. incanae]MEA9606472.1 hypothetical protein [Xanthomonas campestris pv. plantaginis]MEA9611685.1 hypothetical protein [Xanthomonas campestris pv. incanae]MEA9621481.1 hypothetical protein [Xanthomonas campestris pv. incanae]